MRRTLINDAHNMEVGCFVRNVDVVADAAERAQ